MGQMGNENKFKPNQNILESHEDDESNLYPPFPNNKNPQNQSQNNDSIFMGKRNQTNIQQTAPSQNVNKKGKASTINVEELQGAVHAT